MPAINTDRFNNTFFNRIVFKYHVALWIVYFLYLIFVFISIIIIIIIIIRSGGQNSFFSSVL